jgi:hypothetical protein
MEERILHTGFKPEQGYFVDYKLGPSPTTTSRVFVLSRKDLERYFSELKEKNLIDRYDITESELNQGHVNICFTTPDQSNYFVVAEPVSVFDTFFEKKSQQQSILEAHEKLLGTPEGKRALEEVRQKFKDEELQARAARTKENLFIQRNFIRPGKIDELIDKICADNEENHHLTLQAHALFDIAEKEGEEVHDKRELCKELRQEGQKRPITVHAFNGYLFVVYQDMANNHEIWKFDTCLLSGV